MKKSKDEQYTSQDLEEQRRFVKALNERGFSYPLIAAEAFVRGMRDSGYKSTATALDEFIDNAIQAQADQVDVVMGYAAGNTSKKKPDYLAVVDNGHGMDPDMIRLAVLWGGTHRENDRRSFGRYGFGLPSAAVSMSRSFAVISRVPGEQWQSVRIDLDDLAKGKLNSEGVVKAPPAVPGQIPAFVQVVLPEGDLAHGTIVLLDNLDRLTWKTSSAMKENLLHHVGLIYRELLRSVKIRVIDGTDEKVVEPIDPLFLRPDGRYYDDDNGIHAEALPSASFSVKDRDSRDKEVGTVRVRYSYMPDGFQRRKDGSLGPRWKVMKENNGFIILRAGRQIDVVTKIPDKVLQTYDCNWGLEIDFDPTLDEYFGVTTNKQQITISEGMWAMLTQNGVLNAMKEMHARFMREKDAKKGKKRGAEDKESEQIAAETLKLRARKAVPPSPEKEEKSQKLLEEETKRIAKDTGKPEETVKKEIESRPFKVDFEELPGAPFYRMLQVGGQKQLRINLSHRFYSDVYAGPHTSARLQAALELLLIVLGECELDSEKEREAFYRTERPEWSRRLEIMLEDLDQRDPIVDSNSAAEAVAEQPTVQ